ncbi:ependymin-related protein 1-like [Haliotis rufescens]|uniref:ependymin-related protein 1-like n=1 Tax=Haliotis rufescens TaxID=6454 RepID=UPI001EB08F94|nr:ependymin-related protein 1-like [Haliotis rufescens]
MFQLLLVTLMSMIGWVRPTTTPFSHIPAPTTSALPHIPRPCCTHSVFQAVLGEIGGVYVSNASQAIPIDGWNKLFYDYDRKLMALEAHDRSLGRYQTVNIVMDFNTKKQYITDNGRCTIVDIHEEMQHPCVPGSATYLGSSYFGYGEERVEFVSWEFPTRSSDVMVKLTVSSRNCIPITEAMYGTLRGVKTAVSYSFAEFQPSIQDYGVFAIPKHCQNKQTKKTPMARHSIEGIRTFQPN